MNRLTNEKSPYLRQHASNPVDWYPWGEEAISRARGENKPILVSIGYSSCHWCHVMERESFENREIAKIMNENFINIKVDREERPDIDEIYMNTVQIITGGGGWPLTVFLSPELKPFYGGTYFPPEDRGGVPGFKRVLLSVAEHYRNNPEKVDDSCEKLLAGLKEVSHPAGKAEKISSHVFDETVRNFRHSFDGIYGGFGGAPKFPRPMDIVLLIKLSELKDYQFCGDMALLTLRRMADGGIRDHIAGGFHRYSVDERWFAPHFEKMLYDNALLSSAYLEGYRLSGDRFFLSIAKETLNFLMNEMTSAEGLFYSALDADSEGEEGKYYLWEKKDVISILGADDAKIFCDMFGVEESGNFEENRNIVFMRMDAGAISKKYNIEDETLAVRISKWKNMLNEERKKRARPMTDDKCVTSWNGYAISAFARAFMLTGSSQYLDTALKAADYLISGFSAGNEIYRIYKDGKGYQEGFLEDYGSLMLAFISLYRATFDVKWLEHSVRLRNKAVELFWDDDKGGFFSTGEGRSDVIVRSKNSFDNATPAGNSMCLEALVNLWLILKNNDELVKIEKTIEIFYSSVSSAPQAYPAFLSGLFDYFFKKKELFAVLRDSSSLSGTVVSLSKLCGAEISLCGAIEKKLSKSQGEFLLSAKDKRLPDDKLAAYYYCDAQACRPPVYDTKELAKLISKTD